jgi:hypothetical protein
MSGLRISATMPDGTIARREVGAATLVEAVEMLANMGARPITISPHLKRNKELLEGWKLTKAGETPAGETDADDADLFG